ncbi:nucleolar protein 58-like [Anneissia japonica]|uniref:nucleolar protein 58-like n=1 Tax=Anneissia japonica TaxID=1529436 RepID=UPI0014255D85|nr:nucleolar protein 58-like [Anneissia japonica]
MKGLHNPKDCERYIKYLLGERQRQFEVDPRIWRNPPRIAPRGRYYHKRDKTVDYESEEDDADVQSEPPQRRPQTAVSSSGYGRPSTSKTPSKPTYEKRFPSGQPTDQQLYYDTKVRQLKSPDQREKDEEKKKKERKKKKRERSKKRDKTEQNTTKKYPSEAQDSEDNSLEKKEGNSKEKEHSEYKNNTEENVESQKREIRKKPSRTVKKDSPRRESIKNSKGKANPKEDGNTKQVKSRRRSIKKDKSPKELEKEALNENKDADSRAIETVKQNNDHENALDKDEITPAFNDQPSDEEPVDNTTEFNSQVQIFVGEEPDEDFDKEEEDELGEFMFENRLRQQKPDDTISVYSSFSVDMAITKTPAPSELEY